MAPAPPPPRTGERIAKLLARAGVASRREIERMIAEGRVALGGVAIDTPATLLVSLDGITVDGTPVAAPAAARLFVYHKPPGLLVTERDPRGRPTIYDRLPAGLPRVVPVGRLDLATEGLLLLTTDGGLKRRLELPATGVERTYRARAYGPITQARLEELSDGIEIEGMRYGSIDANLERRTGANTWIELTLTEGKNREVRRVLEHLGLEVSRLIRTRYGPFVLGDLTPGAVGEVRAADLAGFLSQLDRKRKPDAAIAVAPLATTPPKPEGRRPGASADPIGADSPKEPIATARARPHPSGAARLPPSPAGRGKGPARRKPGGKGEGEPGKTATTAPPVKGQAADGQGPRPPRPVRKPGWARPKPRSGPKRPRSR